MATIIEQSPLFTTLPVGQEVIFVVSNQNIVSTLPKVKFVAEVHISTGAINLSTTTDLIGTFKTTPNNTGVGIFDFSSVIENYVKSDNMASNGSEYKGTATTDDTRHPLHLIDKFSKNKSVIRNFAVKFKVEYLDTTTNQSVQVQPVNSGSFNIFNGYLKNEDTFKLQGSNFGYDVNKFILNATFDSFLTNAPLQQSASLNDYGVMSYLATNGSTDSIKLEYYDEAGSSLGTETIDRTTLNGAYDTWNSEADKKVVHFGVFPANLRNWSATFQAITSDVNYYTVAAYTSGGVRISLFYTINVTCPDLKGYEPIRLAWLNQWGCWDYFTFNKKSVRRISTKGSTYNQLAGSWNENKYRVDSFKGGKKAFRVNATEKITINTDYVSEAETEWFEELVNSPEVYIVDKFQIDIPNSLLNNYVIPVRLETKSFDKKTIANDKLIQYTFEVEKSKTLRTQSV